MNAHAWIHHLYGIRTLIAGLAALVCLVVGLLFVEPPHRHEVYLGFSAGVGAVVSALAYKSIRTAGLEKPGAAP